MLKSANVCKKEKHTYYGTLLLFVTSITEILSPYVDNYWEWVTGQIFAYIFP